MTIDPALNELAQQLIVEDPESVRVALVEIAELLDLWSAGKRTGAGALLADAKARSFVRSRLMEFIDRGPKRPIVDTAIWVLGKLYDESLEPYFAKLALLFLYEDELLLHLRQTILALDNLEVFQDVPSSKSFDEAPLMRSLIKDYLQERKHPSKY